MGKETEKLERRIKENIRNYTIEMLLGEKQMEEYLGSFADVLQMDIRLLNRQGDEMVSCGEEKADEPVPGLSESGRILTVQGRTLAQLYMTKRDGSAISVEEETLISNTLQLLEQLAAQTFLYKETAAYLDELEENKDTRSLLYHLEKEDGLTGVYNKASYEEKMRVIDRSEMVPVALVYVNINDWKFVNENYGDDESDRLIQIVAGILKQEAGEGYIIGRVDGDVFHVLIPMVKEGEAEDYKERVQSACLAYEDELLAPSAAVGIQYKTNVEENLTKMISDAEYEMFQNKFDLKNEPGYTERLHKGLNKKKD